MAFNRAMTEAQKEARRADILKVALHRFTLMPYESLSMADTAEEAGVAKGTLYLYFSSKEQLFFTIYSDEMNAWFDELDRELGEAEGEASIAAFLRLMGESLTRRPQLLRLIAILHTVLERNLDETTARRSRSRFKQRIEKTGRLLEGYLPFLQAGEGAKLLLKIDALIIGFQHLAEPSDVIREVLKDEDMALFRLDLKEQLLDTLRTLLMGLAYQAKYRNEK